MDLFVMIAVVAFLVVVFVVLQLITILFLLDENRRIGELMEENEPPF
jgi:hypothetical protein